MASVNASTKAANRASRLSSQDIAGPHAGTQAFSYDLAQPPSARLRDSVRLVACEKGRLGAQAGVGAARHASCRTTRAAQRRAHKALSQATRSRRLWPAAARMALIASPGAPNR